MNPAWLQYAAIGAGLALWLYLGLSLMASLAINRSKRRSVAAQVERKSGPRSGAQLRHVLWRILR